MIYTTSEGSLIVAMLEEDNEDDEEEQDEQDANKGGGGGGGARKRRKNNEYVEQRITVQLSNTSLSTTMSSDDELTVEQVGTLTCHIEQVVDPRNATIILDTCATLTIPEIRLRMVRAHYVLLQSILISNIGAPPDNLFASSSTAALATSSTSVTSSSSATTTTTTTTTPAVRYQYGDHQEIVTPHRLDFHVTASSLSLTVSFLDDASVDVELRRLDFDYCSNAASDVKMGASLRDVFITTGGDPRAAAAAEAAAEAEAASFKGLRRTSVVDQTLRRSPTTEVLFSANRGLNDREPILTYRKQTSGATGDSTNSVHLEPFVLHLHPLMVSDLPYFFTLEDEEM